ncbi:uncharacterized protein FIBRA_08078 [Fibroporia radiculosa]|uniref:NAD(P)-binding protein n=1 Tax=Fibroporia radiculosa TaxID=599839 RepID=J4I233_9APHY|nr:uncharacterized protein FIBRA_08078 [Fibroporia radiculosa]CCM05842.1 predicted protein [Fibroporia radiculosa]
MPSLSIARAANAKFAPSYLPVAVFVGGTSGIGQGVAEAFARHTKGNAHIILCGRNKSAAESIIASFPRPTAPEAKHEFIQCDATLMKNVGATTSSLLSRLAKINFLVLTPGIMTLRGRDETPEGIDKKLALHYYARWKFTQDLIPLLRKAKEAGEDAKAMTILAAGVSGKIDFDDLALRKHYSVSAAAKAAPIYNDLMIESFAEQHPDLSFVHASPGIVRTPLAGSIVQVLAYPFAVSAEECGEYMLHAIFNAESGAHLRNGKGDVIKQKGYCGPEDARKQLWEHTVKEVEVSA